MPNKLIATLTVIALAALAFAACGDDGPDGQPSNGAPTSVTSRSGTPSALTTTVVVASAAAAVGDEVAIEVTVGGIGEPGIGGWPYNLLFDTDVVSLVDCPSVGTMVCNPAFRDNAVRFAGAVAEGLQGDVLLGTITFRCETSGTAEIAIELELLADGTLGDPRTLNDTPTMDGEIVCG